MAKYLLPKNFNSYKANMHCHSTFSDGAMTPQEIKEHYKKNGYSVVAFTDHEAIFDHSYLNEDDFLAIPGYEREINSPADVWDDVITCHMCIYPKDKNNINCIAFDPDFVHPKFRWMHTPELKQQVTYLGEPYKVSYNPECINYIISEAKKYGFLVTVNHLEWSQERYEQFSQYKNMDALEIYNHSAATCGWDMNDSLYYDALLRLGNKIRCVAADDNHRSVVHGRPDVCGGYIVIKAPKLDHESIMGAFERGEYYSSTGPRIDDYYIEDGKLHITTSEVKKIRLVTGNRLTRLAIPEKNDEYITSATFDIKDVVGYFRVEVIDYKGNKAYTNATFIEDLKEI